MVLDDLRFADIHRRSRITRGVPARGHRIRNREATVIHADARRGLVSKQILGFPDIQEGSV